MVLSYLHHFFTGLLPLLSCAQIFATGGGVLVPAGTEPTLCLNGVTVKTQTNHVFSFLDEGVPTIIVSPSEITYKYDSLRSRVADVYIANKVPELTTDDDEELDPSAITQPISNIHFEYDENNRIRKISNSQGAFILFFCEDNNKISKIIYHDGTVLFDSHSLFKSLSYPNELEHEEKLDCIKLLFAGSQESPPNYYEIVYYRNAQNQWKFGYKWQFSFFPFDKVAELSKSHF